MKDKFKSKNIKRNTDDFQGVHLTRGTEVAKENDGLVWPQVTLDEFESAKKELVKRLRSDIRFLTKAKDSKVVTDTYVRIVLEKIVVGRYQSAIIRISRIASVLAVLGGGAALNRGLSKGDPLLIGVGIGLAITLTAFQELLLHFKH